MLPLDMIVELFPHLTVNNVYFLGFTCMIVHEKMAVHLSTRLECLRIDLEVVNKFTGLCLKDVYLSAEEILELRRRCQKLNYSSLYCCYIDFVFQHIENLCLANNALSIRKKIRNDSGLYDYYGVDGSFSSLAYLYTATKFSSFDTFKNMLKEFGDFSSKEAYCDNIYLQRADIPENILEVLENEKTLQPRRSALYEVIGSNGLPLARRNGDLVDCDFLLSISKSNKNNKISEFLSQLKGYILWSVWWDDEDDKHPSVTSIVGKEVGCLVAIPKGPWRRPKYYRTMKRLVEGHMVVSCGDVKIYKLE